MEKNDRRMDGYFAAILTEESATILRGMAKHPNIHCHHATMFFRPSLELYHKHRDLVGSRVEINVVGIACDEKAQAVLIEGIPSDKLHPHITISCADGVPPNHSNEVLSANSIEPLRLRLEAKIKYIRFSDKSVSHPR